MDKKLKIINNIEQDLKLLLPKISGIKIGFEINQEFQKKILSIHKEKDFTVKPKYLEQSYLLDNEEIFLEEAIGIFQAYKCNLLQNICLIIY